MKGIFLFLILLVPFSVWAHPGKVDKNGGHRCWSNCEKYGLEYGEYHIHSDRAPAEKSESASAPIRPSPKKYSGQSEKSKLFWMLYLPIAVLCLILMLLWEALRFACSLVWKKIRERKSWPQNTKGEKSGMFHGQTNAQEGESGKAQD